MPIEVTCAQCGKTLKAPDGLAGKKAKCPGCSTVLIVPEPAEEIVDAEVIESTPLQANPSPSLAGLLDGEQGYRVQADSNTQSTSGSGSRRPCPACGEMVAIGAAKCRFCGEFFDANLRRRDLQSGRGRGSHRSGEQLAPRLHRLAAAIVDGLIAMAAAAPGAAVVASLGQRAQKPHHIGLGLGMGVLISTFALLCLAIIQLYFLCTQGQTIGKKALRIRIVRLDDGSNPGFVGAVLLRTFIPGLIGGVPCIGWTFAIVDILCIFGEERRCIHDQIAGTIVIEA